MFFFDFDYETSWIRRGFEQLSSSIAWRVIGLQSSARNVVFAGLKRNHCYCCNRKARAACAQSVTLWQQATIEIMRRNHSIIACSHHIYMGVVLRAHLVRGETHIQRNASREVATISPPFTTNRTDRTFFLWRLHLARPWHPGYSTILLRSESPSSKCAKRHTVASGDSRRKNIGGYCVAKEKCRGANINISPALWFSVVMSIGLLWLTLWNSGDSRIKKVGPLRGQGKSKGANINVCLARWLVIFRCFED